jgi:hypothetical protein
MEKKKVCPDCESTEGSLDRRDFLRTVGVTAAAASTASLPLFATARAVAAPSKSSPAETAVKALYDTLTDEQKKVVCFDWDFVETAGAKRGLLRTRVSNNWHITKPAIRSDFYTKQQQTIIHDIFRGVINPEWYARFLKQLRDDTRGKAWGEEQNIAIFGKPGGDQFEFVMTGRHMTLRADGNSEAHVAFGGPIFYGHAASGDNEKPGHPGNVFWEQARKANFVYQMLDGKQRKLALVETRPEEEAVAFQGEKGKFPGIPVTELSRDQKAEVQKVLLALLEPYRKEDQAEALECLRKQGGLDKCSLAFYQDGDIGKDGEWDNWRLEGPSFVWYFRGQPHVHVWVNVADDASVKLNA